MSQEHIDALLGPAPTDDQPPATPTEEVTPEQPEAPQPTQPPRDDKAANLQAALHEERERRKELQDRLRQMEGRWDQVVQNITTPQPGQTQAQAAPDPEVDPLGHLEYQNRQLAAKLQHFESRFAQADQVNQFQSAVTQLQSRVASDEQAFAKANPQYVEAANWVLQRRVAELDAMGLAPNEQQAVIAQEALALAQRAYQQGSTPAAKAWEMAHKLGWKPNAQASAPGQGQPRDDQGRFAAPTSLAGTGGAPVKADVGLTDDLTQLSNKDFDALFERMMKGT